MPHDVVMDLPHVLDQRLGLGARRIGGATDECGGAAQPAEQIAAEIGVVPYPGQRQRVQRLQGQRGEAAGEHAGEVRMHTPGRAVRPEQAGVTVRVVVVGASIFGAGKGLEHPAADRFAGGSGQQVEGQWHAASLAFCRRGV